MKNHELLCMLIIVIIIIILILSNTNNQPEVKQKLKENFIEQSNLKATFYEGCNYQGASFELGPVYMDDPYNLWIPINSIRIPDGLTVTLETVRKDIKTPMSLTFYKSVDCIRDLPNYKNIYNDTINRILVEKNSTHNYNTIKSGYIEKDYNIYQTPESDYKFYNYSIPNDKGTALLYDTLENCKKKCDLSGDALEACKAFTRPKNKQDTDIAACYFKQTYYLYPTDRTPSRPVNLFKIPNDPEWKTYVKYKGSPEENEDKAAAEKAEADARGITVEALRADKVARKEAEKKAAEKAAAEKKAAEKAAAEKAAAEKAAAEKAAAEKAEADARGITVEALRADKIAQKEAEKKAAEKAAAEKAEAEKAEADARGITVEALREEKINLKMFMNIFDMKNYQEFVRQRLEAEKLEAQRMMPKNPFGFPIWR
jgi:hypothetical protein